jgi:hypothetical protein
MEKNTFSNLSPHKGCPLKEMGNHGRTLLLKKEAQ